MIESFKNHLQNSLNEIRESGLYKEERLILSPQSTEINVQDTSVLNFCSNNYLGLSSHPEIINAAKKDKKIYEIKKVVQLFQWLLPGLITNVAFMKEQIK